LAGLLDLTGLPFFLSSISDFSASS